MTIDLRKDTGVPLSRQTFNWRELVQTPYSKLDDDAFTRVRVVLMNGIEAEAVNFGHSCARMNQELRRPLAEVRRAEHFQQTLVNWLNPPDQSPLETTIAYEQVAVEVTASVAQNEPDPYLAQVYRFGLLEDFDHLYRYSALMDRLLGKDANNILQSYTDVVPGRPTSEEHRAPSDDLRTSYDAEKAAAVSKMNALTILAAEQQAQNYYMNIGPQHSDPVARQLYAEIAAVKEQHVTQYESIIDPKESWLEKWVLHEATEVYNYYSCMEQETNPRIKTIWEQFLDYELGHLAVARDHFEKHEHRDAAEILPAKLPNPISFDSHRDFIRKVLQREVDLRAVGPEFVASSQVPARNPSSSYRKRLNADGSPSEMVAAGYRMNPGTELSPESKGDGQKERRAR